MPTMGRRTEPFRSASLVEFSGIPSTTAKEVWPTVYPVIADAVAGMGETSDSIMALVESKAAQLWTMQKEGEVIAAVVTQVTEHPSRKVCSVIICTGTGMAEWVEHSLLSIEKWAASNGCTHMKHDARMGWQKVLKPFGYQATHVILEKAL